MNSIPEGYLIYSTESRGGGGITFVNDNKGENNEISSHFELKNNVIQANTTRSLTS